MRFDLNAILKIVEVVAGVAGPIMAAVRAGKVAVTNDLGQTLSAADVQTHVDAAEAKRVEVSDATVGRIEDRHRDDTDG